MNLGCGQHKLPGWTNVDCQKEAEPDVLADLLDRWPWPTSSVGEVRAEHFLEHLTSDGFLWVMRELWRVCRNGAKVKVLLPHPRHDIFLNDPTHILALMPASFFGFSSKHLAALVKQGIHLTPLYKQLGVDFNLGNTQYWFDPSVDKDDPELEWKFKHLNNIVTQWGTTMTVVK